MISATVIGKLDMREAELPEPVAGEEEVGISPDGLESGVVEELPNTEEALNADL